MPRPERTTGADVKGKVGSVVKGALGAVTSKLEEWLQKIPGRTTEVKVQF